MAGATGLETDLEKNEKSANNGQNDAYCGQNKSYAIDNENDAKMVNVNLRSKNDQNMSHTGHPKNITRAECEHNMSRTEMPKDLQKICEIWQELPEAVRQGIIAIVKHSK